MKRHSSRAIFFVSLALLVPGVLIGAQIETPGPFHLSHLEGVVVNQSGMPIVC